MNAGMNYIRGDEAEYNAWELLGNKGWNWDGILPYFKRSENFTIPTPEQLAVGVTFEEVFHGEDGFLTTGFPFGITNSSSFYEDYSQAWDTIGVTRNADLDSGHTEGFGLYPQTLDRDAATRESSARAYYQPIESRENLKIVQGTVSKINWGNGSGESLLADGVEYVAPSGEVGKIDVAREVILSAGSFRSPLVLEASGIGHAE